MYHAMHNSLHFNRTVRPFIVTCHPRSETLVCAYTIVVAYFSTSRRGTLLGCGRAERVFHARQLEISNKSYPRRRYSSLVIFEHCSLLGMLSMTGFQQSPSNLPI